MYMTRSFPAPATPAELAAAYRAAAEREAQRVREGAAIIGYKVGYTNTKMWEQLGATEPMWGAMYDDTVVFATGRPFRYSLAPFHGPRIEPEIVVHFHKAPPSDATFDTLLDCIDWMAQGYEIVVSATDGQPPTATRAIANGGMHGALLIAEQRPVEKLGSDPSFQLERVEVELCCDGELKEKGSGTLVLGNPLNSVLHLVKALMAQGRPPIKAGDIVTTGTLTAAYPIAAGQRWTTTLSGMDLPDLDVVFE